MHVLFHRIRVQQSGAICCAQQAARYVSHVPKLDEKDP